VFSNDGEKPISDMTMTKLLCDDGIKGVTVHGFRSAFTDWSSERTHFPKEVADKALAHKLSNKVEAAYRRTDFFEKRRNLMARWAEFLDKAPAKASKDAGPTASKPMPLRVAA
jgi:integrase